MLHIRLAVCVDFNGMQDQIFVGIINYQDKKKEGILFFQITFELNNKNTVSLMTKITLTLFSQIITKLDRTQLKKLVDQLKTDKVKKGYSS